MRCLCWGGEGMLCCPASVASREVTDSEQTLVCDTDVTPQGGLCR